MVCSWVDGLWVVRLICVEGESEWALDELDFRSRASGGPVSQGRPNRSACQHEGKHRPLTSTDPHERSRIKLGVEAVRGCEGKLDERCGASSAISRGAFCGSPVSSRAWLGARQNPAGPSQPDRTGSIALTR